MGLECVKEFYGALFQHVHKCAMQGQLDCKALSLNISFMEHTDMLC